MDVDVASLRMLRAVADAGTITGAAALLGLSQPAVSQHVRRLERRLGTALLDRSGRSVRLTEAGEALARHGATVASALRAANAEVSALAGIRSGRVRLVAFPSSSATLVPRALADLRARHPGLTVTLDEAEPPESLRALRAGRCDVALVFSYPGSSAGSSPGASAGSSPGSSAGSSPGASPGSSPSSRPVSTRGDDLDGLVARHLLDDATRVVLPAGHPRADDPDLALADLADERWIAGCPRCRGHLLQSAAASGFVPDIAFATDDYVAVLGLVEEGLGVAVLPDLVLPTARRHPGVVLRRARGTSARRVHAVTTPDLVRVPAVTATIDALAAAAAA